MVKVRDYVRDRDLSRFALAQSPSFYYIKDRDSRFRVVNDAVARLHGFERPADMRGLTDAGMRIPRLDVCLGDDVETQTWRVYPLTAVESNYERFIRALRQGETLEPSFAHAANLQRILDKAIEAEVAPAGQTVVVDVS